MKIGVWEVVGNNPVIYYTTMKELKKVPAPNRYILPNGTRMTKQNTKRVELGEHNDGGEGSPYWEVEGNFEGFPFAQAIIWE